MREKLMEVAERCKPDPPPPREILSIGETMKRISKHKENLKAARFRIDVVNSKLDDLRVLKSLNETIVIDLQEEILRLEATIHPVTVAQPRRHTPKKSEREELLNLMLNMSEKDLNDLQKKVKEGK